MSALEAPTLRALLRAASHVVVGEIVSLEDRDDGRVAIAHVNVQQWLKGDGENPLRIAVQREALRAAPIKDGQRALGFLREAQRTSYLSHHAGRGPLFEVVEQREGWFAVADASDLREMAAIAQQVVSTSAGVIEKDQAKRATDRRGLVFRMVAAPHARIVRDGIDSLASVSGLAETLSETEKSALWSAFKRQDLDRDVRRQLVASIAALQLRQMAAALREDCDPTLTRDCLRALRLLGEPAERDQLLEKLASGEATMRIAAIAELLQQDVEEGIRRVAPLAANDGDRDVRLAAIAALGATKRDSAVVALEKVFGDDDVAVRQASARALRTIGGEAAADALQRLAFTGPISSQRFAVFVMMSLGMSRDDPRIRRIAETHSDEEIHEMLEHGLSAGHSH